MAVSFEAIGVGVDNIDNVDRDKVREVFRRAAAGDASILMDSRVWTFHDHDGSTPLHEMARCGHAVVLTHPQVASVCNEGGHTPLHVLARSGLAVTLKHPLVGIVRNQYGQTPLHELADCGNSEAKERLKKEEFPARDLPQKEHKLMWELALSGNFIYENPFDSKKKTSILPDENLFSCVGPHGYSPIHAFAATPWGAPEVLKHFSVTFIHTWRGLTPMHVLASPKQIRIILGDEYERRVSEGTLLGRATPEMVEALLAHDHVAKAKDNEGRTPLHYLCEGGHERALSHPLASTIRSWKGHTPAFLFRQVQPQVVATENSPVA